jgi:hypothetical protein
VTVHGSITVAPGAVLLAAFSNNDVTHSGKSSLTVTGNVVVQAGAAAALGCFASSFACIDDPNMTAPTLDSKVTIDGNVTSTNPLGVLVHDGTIKGNVIETGGGGGLNCKPTGVFTSFHSPAYSDYEDSSMGSLTVKNKKGCYLGIYRLHVKHNMTIDNKLADPDAIEIGTNTISGNLACTGNSMVWDTSEIKMGATYPRKRKPNTVHGKRSGQCKLSSPIKKGGKLGPGAF